MIAIICRVLVDDVLVQDSVSCNRLKVCAVNAHRNLREPVRQGIWVVLGFLIGRQLEEGTL